MNHKYKYNKERSLRVSRAGYGHLLWMMGLESLFLSVLIIKSVTTWDTPWGVLESGLVGMGNQVSPSFMGSSMGMAIKRPEFLHPISFILTVLLALHVAWCLVRFFYVRAAGAKKS